MNPKAFWHNFNMNAELHISGSFVYNGLYRLAQMKNVAREDEVFEVLYNISVGIERLLKISLVLTEEELFSSQSEFEDSLRTHSHQELFRRLNKHHELKLSANDNSFIQVLSRFYNRFRYDRYVLASVYDFDREIGEFKRFLSKCLGIPGEDEFLPQPPLKYPQ